MTWRDWVLFATLVSGVALLSAAVYFWASSGAEDGRREFIEDCQRAGFRAVELEQELLCVNQDGIKIASW